MKSVGEMLCPAEPDQRTVFIKFSQSGWNGGINTVFSNSLLFILEHSFLIHMRDIYSMDFFCIVFSPDISFVGIPFSVFF